LIQQVVGFSGKTSTSMNSPSSSIRSSSDPPEDEVFLQER